VVGQASELDVGQLQVGLPGSARLASGLTVNGRIRYIATVADEATRTFRVELEVVNPDRLLRAGATAEIRIPVETVSAQRLSPAALTLDDVGRLGVRTVGDSDIVAFAPIRIFSSDLDGVWVTGLGDRATVITVGQEFVRHGEKVVPVIDETAPSS
jgi:multidrug efflux system membrane fusion protein